MNKKIIMGITSIALLFTSISASYADESELDLSNIKSSNEVLDLEKFEELAKKYDVDLELPNQQYNFRETEGEEKETTTIKLKTIEEAEAFLKEFSELGDVVVEEEASISDLDSEGNPKIINTQTHKSSSSLWGKLFTRCFRFQYEYNKVNGAPQFVRVFNRTSYLEGITPFSWNVYSGGVYHKFESHYNQKDSVRNFVEGYYKATVTIEVGGGTGVTGGITVPINTRKDAKWEFYYTLRN